uniref:Uncharacterized protein n=1 Tax=Cryptomonas curvata TaxID=233186 RepID=A0A679CA46_9CRYP|nr:hypothetical protein CcuCCAP97952_p101 [Cryptomonas curvata]
MIPTLQTFKYHYCLIYCVALYSFFIYLNCKKEFPTVNNNTDSNTSLSILSTYSSTECSSKENKILLDLKYKHIIHLDTLTTKSFSYTIDLEGKILGHRTPHNQKFSSNVTNISMNLNKKLLHSTIFGSIKLIKI